MSVDPGDATEQDAMAIKELLLELRRLGADEIASLMSGIVPPGATRAAGAAGADCVTFLLAGE